MASQNKNIILAERPDGLPAKTCWQLVSTPIPSLKNREVLVEVKHISLDPAMRAWMNEYCYIGGVDIGETMRAFAVGKVLESQHPAYQAGDYVRGMLGVQEYSVTDGDDIQFNKLRLGNEPLSNHLGILGMTGLTAYVGITKEVDIKPGQQVLVSSAAGAVGSTVAQIAKIKGAYVVGIAGGNEKANFCIDELGLDDCIDYKAGEIDSQLSAKMPNGVDVYFDNVGVPILDHVLDHINERSVTLICGAINQFQTMDNVTGPNLYLRLAERISVMKGFTYYHYLDCFAEAVVQLKAWIDSGQLKHYEHHEQGLEDFHQSFNKLFTGANHGKLIITL